VIHVLVVDDEPLVRSGVRMILEGEDDIEVVGEAADGNEALEQARSLEPDVEALLVYKRETGFECYIAPIDVCYELVGRIRKCWKGFHGGAEAWG